MRSRPLSMLIAVALVPGTVSAQTPAPSPAEPPEAARPTGQPTDIDAIRVTGSLIPRAQIEGPSPVTTITAEQMEQQGFTNLFDALRALPQSSGPVQDAQSTGTYTPGAKTVSLFGLSPSYTLTLINGRPVNSYPLGYNGNTSIVDIANIPMGMVERVDVLTGGQSSVYGSAAIAGVVNIVLKDRIEGAHARYRVGDYSDGGGENHRLQFSAGHAFAGWDISYGLQYETQKPIYAFERDATDSAADNPTGPVDPARTFLRQDLTVGATGYIDPGAATCAPLSYLYGGSTEYALRDIDGGGRYCGSLRNVGTASLLSESESASGSLFLRRALGEHAEFYTDVLLSYSRPTYTGGSPSWNQSFYNQTTGRYEQWQRIFAPEEVGLHAKDQRVYTRSYNVAAGVRGTLGDSGFDYDVYLNRSGTGAIRKATDFLARNGVDDHYLGPKLGVDAAGYPIHAPDEAALYRPITPEQYDAWSAINRAKSTAWNQGGTALLTHAELFTLPAGPVGFAAIVQGQRERFSNRSQSADARDLFRNAGGGTIARGERDLYAAGVEFQVPVTGNFDINLSGRYDKYALDGGGGNGKPTWKAGLEFRPFDTLLLRGSYATAFRSPDMFYLYASETSGFTTTTDEYRCRQAGYGVDDYDACPQADQSTRHLGQGNRDLRDITARTFTYGVVWSTPGNALTMSLDYNAIEIEDEVELLGIADILELEANCRLGVSENGQTRYDIDSPTCRDVIGQVQRRPDSDPVDPNGVAEVRTYPINLARQRQTGVQAAARYRWNAGSVGDFDFDLGYYRTLSHDRQPQADDPVEDLLCCANSNELQHRTTASVAWNRGPLAATLWGVRNARSWNAAGSARDIGPWTTFNGSVSYRFGERYGVLFSVNNIANRKPPLDRTNGNWPFYDRGLYNALGRSLQMEWSMDL
ncbi:TonB-dependent receptor [Luteimonas sp. RC10]|uniref:TonB-dependent receptor plug domain-containing protein n=1 Tax=Luteimonas sp. RC10 TaxID=2587035 RepID=UPI001619DC75|nr:TonB-dependent receptor [Luteimonas sp. RC10]MBB3343392.1 outer membrane receptor protein involved in Fe transport [Luteimonas sp. RC10]